MDSSEIPIWMKMIIIVGSMAFIYSAIRVGGTTPPPSPITAPAPASSCPPTPCRDEAMSVIDSDGQRIECSSERHVLSFLNVENRVFAFCRCGGGPPPVVDDMPPSPPIGIARPLPGRKP